MDPLLTTEKLANEIINEFRLPQGLCFSFIQQRLNLAWTMGYNEGTKQGPRPPTKQVVQITKEGKHVRTFESITHAAKVLGLDTGHISKICLGRKNYKSTHGYRFMYASEYFFGNEKEYNKVNKPPIR